MNRAFKYRFYPSPEQAEGLCRTLGCVRLVYNKGLEARTRAYRQDGRRTSYGDSSAALTGWKRTSELAFLGEVSCVPLQQALRHLNTAFGNFFAKRAGYPRFKSRKRSRAAAEYTRSAFKYRDGRLALAKIPGVLDVVWSRPLPEGVVPSTNRAKARLKVGRVHARVADRRRDHLHKVTTRLVRENQTVVIEDLNTSGMLANHSLARAISDAAWRQFRSMLEYKCAWYGRELVVVDRWFPSTKRCSLCGTTLDALPLHVRTWTCETCGVVHDRDVNATRNILAAGLAERPNACGADVRPQFGTSIPGRGGRC